MAAEGGDPGERAIAEKGASARLHEEARAVRRRGVGGGRGRIGGGPAAGRGVEWGGGIGRHTPPLAGGPSAHEELPPPRLRIALSPRFRSAWLSWQPPGRPARPARGGPAPQLGPTAEPVGSGLALRPERAALQPEVRTARAGALRTRGARGLQARRRGRAERG